MESNEQFICCYCGKECKNKNSLAQHECRCKANPNAIVVKAWNKGLTKETDSSLQVMSNSLQGRKPWNKGLTKETDERILIKANKAKGKVVQPFNGHAATEEKEILRKQKISNAMKNNHNNNPNKTGRGKKGWYKGFYCSSTYELAFVIYCIDHNINIQRCKNFYLYEYNGKQHRYYPDFIIDDTIYEIKGYWNEIVDLKTNSVFDHKIKVLYKEDLKDIFDYIYTTYGKEVDKNISELYEQS